MIELHGLRKTYPDGTQALQRLDLVFGEGIFGLLGPNGAGKTTLLSILVLSQEPSAGRRTYFGLDDRARHRPRIRRLIGYLAQEFEPVASLTGLEYLLYCGEMRQVPLPHRALKARVEMLLEVVGLGLAARRRTEAYSGGMTRRLGLAQALIHAPRLLVVDEPTAGLDPEERIRFRNVVTDIADEIPVLLSTHIVEDVEATCPRIGILARGRLLFDGAPGTVLRQADGSLWQLPATAPLPDGVDRLNQRVGAGGEAVQVVRSSLPVPGARPLEPTLEEAYAAYLKASAADLQPSEA